MRRLVIAVDCDDVLVATMPYLIDEYNRQFGTNVDIKQAHQPGYDGWNAEEDVLMERFGALIRTDAYKELGVSASEKAILTELARDHELHVVTARKPVEAAFTQAMLDRDTPGVFSSLELVGFQGSKGEVCKRLGADILIDDNERHLVNAMEHGLPAKGALLFGEYPWNAEEDLKVELTRCRNWEDVLERVKHLAND